MNMINYKSKRKEVDYEIIVGKDIHIIVHIRVQENQEFVGIESLS